MKIKFLFKKETYTDLLQKINKKKAIKASAIGFLIIVIGASFYFGRNFLKRRAEKERPANYATISGSAEYSVDGGKNIVNSNLSRVWKIDLFKIIVQPQGKNNPNGLAGTFSIINPSANNAVMGTLNFTLDGAGTAKPDWTNFKNLDPNVGYNIKIRIPGYLSKKLTDQSLGESSDRGFGTLIIGDINGDGIINIDDYKIWKENYNKKTQGNDINDFNGDGFINYKDFAIAFGSGNWMKTEDSQ